MSLTGRAEVVGKSAARSMAKHGLRRSGSVLCGFFGFEQHLNIWGAVLAGIAWIVATEHAAFVVRRHLWTRVIARLDRWRAAERIRVRISTLYRRLGGSGITTGRYRTFTIVNATGAVTWGALFVTAGYFATCAWHAGRPNWTGPAMPLAAIATLGCVLVVKVVTPRLERTG